MPMKCLWKAKKNISKPLADTVIHLFAVCNMYGAIKKTGPRSMLGLQRIRKEVALFQYLTCMTCTKTAKENLELAFKCRDKGRISAKPQHVLQLFNISCYPQHVHCIHFTQY